jgi:hypothetical protein
MPIWNPFLNISPGGLENLLSYCKGPSLQDQQKTIKRRFITSKVTLIGQSFYLDYFVQQLFQWLCHTSKG